MDRERFDALVRLLAVKGSRRGALGTFLGVAVLGQSPDTLARPGKRQDRGADQDDRNPKGKRRTTRGRRNARDGDRRPEPTTEQCCGAKRCAPPKPGSTRSQCDHAGRSFAGQDLHGSTFRGIDGRGADFDDTNNRGSVFAEACLQGATFRGADLRGSTWGDACLVDADFTGADLGGDSATFWGAFFCRTVMPDGSVKNRDCGKSNRCCQTCRDVGASCRDGRGARCCAGSECINDECVATQGPGRCPVEVCQVGVRNQQGVCVYVNSPNNQIGPACNAYHRFCCNGNCCRQGDLCLAGGCCTPDPNPCQGRCGDVTDNCGRQFSCGTCPQVICQVVTCNPQTHVCDHTDEPNLTTCTTAEGQGGICCNGACVAGGQCCAISDCPEQFPCRPNQCQSNRCVRITEPDRTACQDDGAGICCGGLCIPNGTCCATSDCPDQTCREKLCSDNICQYQNLPNGEQDPPNCTGQGTFCCGQGLASPATCCSSGQTCSGVTCSGP